MSSTHDASVTTQTDTLLVSLYSCRITSWFLFRQKPYFAQLPFVILASVLCYLFISMRDVYDRHIVEDYCQKKR